MPSFATPEPILVNVEPEVGNVRIIASDRTDTVVDVLPTDPSDSSDVKAAKQTVVDFSGGTLSVKGPKLRPLSLSKQTRSIDVTVEVPEGSRVQGSTGLGDLHTTGRLAECRYKSGLGHLQLGEVGELHLRTATGNVVVERVDGNADISTSSGRVHVSAITGTGVVKNSNGATTIGSAGHSLRVRSSNGDITVEHAEDGVDAKTANGAVRVLDAARGAVTLESAMGDLEVGIREGTAAWLDVNTRFGRVHNDLPATGAPEPGTDKLEVRASTSFGDITVHRS
jgi:putative adhesin